MHARFISLCLVALIGPVFAGCSESPKFSRLAGDYSIESWTLNEDNCDGDGASILENNSTEFTDLLVQICSIFGEEYLNTTLCTGEGCEESRCTPNKITLDFSGRSFNFESGNDSDGWSVIGSNASASEANPSCTGDVIETVMTSSTELNENGLPSGNSIRIEIRSYPVTPFPSVEDCEKFGGEHGCFHECEYEDAKASAQWDTCAVLEVITAKLK